MIALLLGAAHAITVCFDIETDYTDIAGDFWGQNLPRPARGVRYEVSQNGALVQTGYLNNQGCRSVTLPTNDPYSVQIRSQARWKGVDVHSVRGDCHQQVTPAYQNSPTFTAPAGQDILEVLPASDRWNNLQVATWAVHRNKHGLGTGVSRACCLDPIDPACADDGVWQNGNPTDYGQLGTELWLYQNPGPNHFGDWIQDCNNPSTHSGHRALNITQNTHIRTLITHELGHLITSMRMGWSDQAWSLDAGLDGCMGDYKSNNTLQPSDSPEDGGRGEFSKEHLAAAIREGYADFYATWLWNSRTGAGATLDMWTLHDFDLDCTIDNVSTNGEIDLASTSTWSTNPNQTFWFMDGKNWLDDLENASDSRQAKISNYKCLPTAPTIGCLNTPNGLDHDRATIADLAKFFWKLTHTQGDGEGIPPLAVTDLYINTCPRMWDNVDSPITSDAHPYNRLIKSSSHVGYATEVANLEDYFTP